MSIKDTYLSPLVSCLICKEVFTSKGLFTHIDRKHNNSTKYNSGLSEKGIFKLKLKHLENNLSLCKQYYENPSICSLESCSIELDYFKRNCKFCSHSCAASYTNKLRDKQSDETKIKKSIATKRSHEERKQKFVNEFVGPSKDLMNLSFDFKLITKVMRKFTEQIKVNKSKRSKKVDSVYICNCKFCFIEFEAKTKRQICDSCRFTQKGKRFIYKFRFNVYDYPHLFDLDKLNKLGWYSPGGKCGSWNIEGLSRDHKISVSEALNNNYDPFYISHPLNCDLITHKENVRKMTKSSLSYADLVEMVDKYEKLSRSDSN